MTTYLKLNPGCRFYPYEGSSGAQEFLIRTAQGRQFRLSPLAKDLLESLDGSTSLETIAGRLRCRNINLPAEQLESFLEQEYGALGIFENYVPSPSPSTQKNPVPIFLHWGLIPSSLTCHIAKAFTWLFDRYLVVASIVSIAGSHYLVYRIQLPTFIDDEGSSNLMPIVLLALVSALFH